MGWLTGPKLNQIISSITQLMEIYPVKEELLNKIGLSRGGKNRLGDALL